MIELRTPTDDDFDAVARLDGRVFGSTWDPERLARQRSVMDLSRFRIAVDSGQVVGVAGSFALDMTLPGGVTVPTGGVTWVGVSVTHRRQGLLRRLLDAVHDDVDARGEPLAALSASEGGIYERFGYGVATVRRVTSLDPRRSRVRAELQPVDAGVRVVEHDDPGLPALLAERWERVRRLRAGEVGRSDAWHRALIGDRGAATTWLVHDDGFAAYQVTADWNEGHPRHDLELLDLAAATPEAHLALWHTVLSVDLVGTVRSRVVAPDDPLPFLLTDQRALRTVELNDFVWCNVRDVATCFGARGYGTDDEIVVEAEGQRYRIGAGGCTKVRSRPDLVVEHRSALGALLLGGVAPTALAMGRRLTARSSEALRRADAMFVTHPRAHGMTAF